MPLELGSPVPDIHRDFERVPGFTRGGFQVLLSGLMVPHSPNFSLQRIGCRREALPHLQRGLAGTTTSATGGGHNPRTVVSALPCCISVMAGTSHAHGCFDDRPGYHQRVRLGCSVDATLCRFQNMPPVVPDVTHYLPCCSGNRYLTALVMTLTPSFAHNLSPDWLRRDVGGCPRIDQGGSSEEMAEELCVLSLMGGLSTGALLSWAWLVLPRA